MKTTQENINVRAKEAVNKELNLYAMSKEALIKKIQILMHELSIYHRCEEQKSNLENLSIESLHKDLVQKEIIINQLRKNENILQTTLKSRLKEIEQLKAEQKREEDMIGSLKKENDILKKQLIGLQRSKNKENTQKMEILEKQTKSIIEDLEKQNKQAKKTIGELSNKIRILSQLNQQTQQKLADALISKKISSQTSSQIQIIYQNKENKDPNKFGNFKLQNLSLKEQIRQLKNDMRILQESKQTLRIKFQERELLYSRMLPMKP